METPDLQTTSPATITRCNLVYISERDLNLKTVIAKALPGMISKDLYEKMSTLLLQFRLMTVLQILKLAKLIFFRPL